MTTKSEETQGSQIRDSEGPSRRRSRIFHRQTQQAGEGCRSHKEGDGGDPGDRRWKEQWPEKDKGSPGDTDGNRRGVRQRLAVRGEKNLPVLRTKM